MSLYRSGSCLAGRGVRAVESVENLARPELFESDEEWQGFLADLDASCRSGLA